MRDRAARAAGDRGDARGAATVSCIERPAPAPTGTTTRRALGAPGERRGGAGAVASAALGAGETWRRARKARARRGGFCGSNSPRNSLLAARVYSASPTLSPGPPAIEVERNGRGSSNHRHSGLASAIAQIAEKSIGVERKQRTRGDARDARGPRSTWRAARRTSRREGRRDRPERSPGTRRRHHVRGCGSW
jgi:hypothetical protein